MKVGKKYLISRIFLLSLVFLLMISIASAAEFIVQTSPDYQNIQMGSYADYTITIKNNMETVENFEIYSPDVAWDLSTVPNSDRLITIAPGAKGETTLRLKPLYVNPGLYGVKVNVRVSRKNMLISNYVMVGVNDPNPPPDEYLPAVRSNVDIDDVIDPRENVTIKVNLENQNRRDLKELDIRLRSHSINAEHKTNLGPLEKKTVTIKLQIDPLTQPMQDVLRTTIFTSANNKTYQYEPMPVEYEVLQYGNLVDELDTSKEFLKTITTITLTNKGNGDFIDLYKFEKGALSRLFTSGTPEIKKIREDGKSYVGWQVNLGPYEQIELTMVTNYRIPAGILVAAALLIILYYLLRSPITVHKSAAVLATKEGGISELKVLIVLKNRSGKKIKNVNIIDKVPHIAEVSREFEMGTLHPSKMLKHEKRGTLIKWEIKELDKFEERVLAYKIKTKLSVIGDFKLPVTVIKFSSRSGKERSIHSNSVTLIGA